MENCRPLIEVVLRPVCPGIEIPTGCLISALDPKNIESGLGDVVIDLPADVVSIQTARTDWEMRL
jgi:hypothetical protein